MSGDRNRQTWEREVPGWLPITASKRKKKRTMKRLLDLRRRHECASAICGMFHAWREWAKTRGGD